MDITIAGSVNSWQNLNTLSGITVGTGMYLQNKSVNWCITQESVSQPLDDDTSGTTLTHLPNSTAEKTVDEGATNPVWVRPVEYGHKIVLNIQEI